MSKYKHKSRKPVDWFQVGLVVMLAMSIAVLFVVVVTNV